MLKITLKKPGNYLLSIVFLMFLSPMEKAGAEEQILRFAYVGDTSHPAFDGVQQGLEEANLQGSFLGQIYELDSYSPGDIGRLNASRYIALVAAVDKKYLLKLSKIDADVPVFNIAAMDDSLRQACIPNLLHIIPSNKMLRDAESQWHKKQPDSHAKAKAWHHDYVKFAARDLNKRFRKEFEKNMDDYAWAGWAAVKMTADVFAREPEITPSHLLSYLKTRLLFDGQKGIDMKFRETNQLIQPLLLVEDGKILGEAPVRGVVDPDDYSTLGLIHCPE